MIRESTPTSWHSAILERVIKYVGLTFYTIFYNLFQNISFLLDLSQMSTIFCVLVRKDTRSVLCDLLEWRPKLDILNLLANVKFYILIREASQSYPFISLIILFFNQRSVNTQYSSIPACMLKAQHSSIPAFQYSTLATGHLMPPQRIHSKDQRHANYSSPYPTRDIDSWAGCL